MSKKDLRKMFPNLYRELEEGENSVTIDEVQADVSETKKDDASGAFLNESGVQCARGPDRLRNFSPQAVDFLRRCDTLAQAEEIIAFLQKRKEITEEYAGELLGQLREKGVRSFGPKKEEDYYFHEGGIY
ncbi:MAG: DUF2095 domain-containing protein [Nitrososphaerota archaeon]|nr:DUF2095 domain-containing protein [Nitrososphaerota archaeon]